MYGRDFSSQSSYPGRNRKNEKALNLSTDFFNFCYLHGKINLYVVLTRRSMHLDAVTHFSDSLLVMFFVTSRRDKPKRRPSWSIFWFIHISGKPSRRQTVRQNFRVVRPARQWQKAPWRFTAPPGFCEVCLQISSRWRFPRGDITKSCGKPDWLMDLYTRRMYSRTPPSCVRFAYRIMCQSPEY